MATGPCTKESCLFYIQFWVLTVNFNKKLVHYNRQPFTRKNDETQNSVGSLLPPPIMNPLPHQEVFLHFSVAASEYSQCSGTIPMAQFQHWNITRALKRTILICLQKKSGTFRHKTKEKRLSDVSDSDSFLGSWSSYSLPTQPSIKVLKLFLTFSQHFKKLTVK